MAGGRNHCQPAATARVRAPAGLALAASAGRPDMSNQVMRARAQWLLGMADDLF